MYLFKKDSKCTDVVKEGKKIQKETKLREVIIQHDRNIRHKTLMF